jgi:hypothetical protein
MPTKTPKAKRTSAKASKPSKAPARATAKAAKPVNKSKFVRAQPMSMTAKEIVAKAKAQGFSMREDYVYKIRFKAKAKAAKSAKKTATSKAAASSSATATGVSMPSSTVTSAPPAKVNKSAFIRSQPASMTANEVVAAGKAQGIKLTPPQVYVARAYANKKKAGKRGPGRPRKNAAPAAVATNATASGVEGLLRAAAAEIGLSRSMAILSEQRDAVRAVLGG